MVFGPDGTGAQALTSRHIITDNKQMMT